MLFNIILCFLVLYVAATPFFYAKAVRFGMNQGKADGEEELRTWKKDVLEEYRTLLKCYESAVRFGMETGGNEQPVTPLFNIPEDKPKPKMTPEEDRTYQILANIDRYDGTSRGQEEVKVDGK